MGLPVYMQVSLQFADLHDRAGRMKAKDVIRQSLVWRESRRFFYWRVRRRVNEEYILKRMASASKNPLASRACNLETLAAWTGIPKFSHADRDVAMWYEENRKTVHEKVESLKTEGVAFDVASPPITVTPIPTPSPTSSAPLEVSSNAAPTNGPFAFAIAGAMAMIALA